MGHGAVGTIETDRDASLQRRRDAVTQAGDSRRACVRRTADERQLGRALGKASHGLVSVRTLDSLS
ncbi:hypothetical protein BVI1335_770017 [Burkholderia vietnamiensis]|nr:hypothetical protein BVI1335_770017 [Burkholderia vietnamiensis]